MNKNKMIMIILIITSFLTLYFLGNKTYTAYQSLVDNEIGLDIANWQIEIDGQNITTSSEKISLSNIEWESTHTNANTVAPGSKGIVKVIIDPTSTEVAIKYNISYQDHTINPDCILTVTSIYLENEELEKINDNTYSGIITLDQIKDKNTKTLVIHVEWVNDENNNEIDTQIGLNETEANYLELEFNASQYQGE